MTTYRVDMIGGVPHLVVITAAGAAKCHYCNTDHPVGVPTRTLEVRQVLDGDRRMWEGRRTWGEGRPINVGRTWHVYLAGEPVGAIVFRMFTRETRSKGRTYVNSRWESPGWAWSSKAPDPNLPTPYISGLEAYSKLDAIERIIRDKEYNPS